MPYTDNQIRFLKILHGMLEFDLPTDDEMFQKLFTVLGYECGVPISTISNGIGRSEEFVQYWQNGKHLPPQKEWPKICDSVMKLIELEVGYRKSPS